VSEAPPEGLRIRAATLDDRDELLPLRIDLLREAGNIGEESTSLQLLDANLRCSGAKMRTGEFLRGWLRLKVGSTPRSWCGQGHEPAQGDLQVRSS
jgi:hypothetical protein